MVGAIASAAPYAIAGTQALGQLISGAVKKRQANKIQLEETDPLQASMLADINERRQRLEQGTGIESQVLRQQVGQNLAQTQKNILSGAGGNTGMALNALAKANTGAGMAYAQGSIPLINKATQLQAMAVQQANDIAQRKLEVRLWQKIQKMRESAEQTKAGMANLAVLGARAGTLGNLFGSQTAAAQTGLPPTAGTQPGGFAPNIQSAPNVSPVNIAGLLMNLPNQQGVMPNSPLASYLNPPIN